MAGLKVGSRPRVSEKGLIVTQASRLGKAFGPRWVQLVCTFLATPVRLFTYQLVNSCGLKLFKCTSLIPTTSGLP